MNEVEIWITLLVVSVATMIPRMLPVVLLSKLEFPVLFKQWLFYVAPAVLGGLTALSILAPEGSLAIDLKNPYIWAALPTMLVAAKYKSLFGSLAVGIMAMAVLYHLGMH